MSHLKQFGKYEIVRKLSRSLTDVYLACEPDADRLVILKLVEQSSDEFTQLVIEAERRGAILQQQLHRTDARILEVFEFGEQQNCFFVAMEYFEGKTLAELIREKGILDPKGAASYAAEICDHLKTLHSFTSDIDGRRTAIVHGDIKPSNIQIGTSGAVRLLDFGIAKVITLTRNLTHHNLGSPTYCSPERLSTGQVDAHADLWAVGVSLYEMVSGIPPYQAENTRKLENLIQSGRPPRAVPEACPASLTAVITKSLSPNLADRYQSAAAFEQDLRAFLADEPTVAEREGSLQTNSGPTVLRKYVQPQATRVVARTRTVLSHPQRTIAILRSDLRHLGFALGAGFLFALLGLVPLGYAYRFHQASKPLRVHSDYTDQDLSAIASDWQLYHQLQEKAAFLGRFSPASPLTAPFRASLLHTADRILDGVRSASPKQPADIDWNKAQICLRHALELDPSDSEAKGKLALCAAYRNLSNHPKLPKAALSAAEFREAERLLPRSPDPHLGLARLYIYSYRNVLPALSEFNTAEKLGYRLGPREAEEQADGYLLRAEWELLLARYSIPPGAQKNLLALARADTERAQDLYGPIAASSDISNKLRRLNRARALETQLGAEHIQPITYLSARWQ